MLAANESGALGARAKMLRLNRLRASRQAFVALLPVKGVGAVEWE
jgi:hypothetical protein